jgi:hypothetical protein
MKAIQNLSSKTKAFRSCLFELNLATNRAEISDKNYPPKLYVGNDYYLDRTGKLVSIELLNHRENNLTEKEQALVMLRSLIESPGIIKGYDRIFPGSYAIQNLEKHYQSIILERYPKDLAEVIIKMTYTNENAKFTLTAVQETFAALNLSYLNDIISINRSKLSDNEKYQFVFRTNTKPDFSITHHKSQLVFPADHTAVEMSNGQVQLTGGPIMEGKIIFDVSNSEFNTFNLNEEQFIELQNNVVDVGPQIIMRHIDDVKHAFLSKNPTLSLEKRQKYEAIFNEIKNYGESYFSNINSIHEFTRRSIQFQNEIAIHLNNKEIPRINSFLITAALNDFGGKNKTITRILYDENSKIDEFRAIAKSGASKYTQELLEKNQFSTEIENKEESKKLDYLWKVVNNSNEGRNPRIQYEFVCNEINEKIIVSPDDVD